jgi:hypothetical protein
LPTDVGLSGLGFYILLLLEFSPTTSRLQKVKSRYRIFRGFYSPHSHPGNGLHPLPIDVGLSGLAFYFLLLLEFSTTANEKQKTKLLLMEFSPTTNERPK